TTDTDLCDFGTSRTAPIHPLSTAPIHIVGTSRTAPIHPLSVPVVRHRFIHCRYQSYGTDSSIVGTSRTAPIHLIWLCQSSLQSCSGDVS
ncbi:MAG: hypothetical protein NT027_04235, partial [Proteobacteria bacterium]|nr:hypothetical protein [Pseudomonadota bacterium]